MGDLKAIGSEKLTGQDKIKRIMEIARYGESTRNNELHTHTNSFIKKAADGMVYAIVQEKDGYYVKTGLNESNLDYVNGLANKKRNRYRSYSGALKRLNLMLKPINEQYNGGYGDSMYEQEDEEKVVIKAPAAPSAAPTPPPAPTGDEDMDIDVDMDMGDEDMDIDVDMGGGEENFDAEEERPTMKAIQKLTGKLGQKMREYEDEIDSDMIKYVINSVISAVDLDLLDEEDREDIINRLEPELEDEYGMEDDFDVDADMDDDMGDDMDADMGLEDEEDFGNEDEMGAAFDDMGLEESLKRRVNKTIKKYYSPSKKENERKLFNESAKKGYIKSQVLRSKSKKTPIALSETIEQELRTKKVLEKNKNIKFKEKTKNGTLIFEGKHKRLGITKKGEIIR